MKQTVPTVKEKLYKNTPKNDRLTIVICISEELYDTLR